MALRYHHALLEFLTFLGMEVIIEQNLWSCTFIWFCGREINILSQVTVQVNNGHLGLHIQISFVLMHLSKFKSQLNLP